MGPDDVIIRSSDDFWQRTGYFRQLGILIMVGVRGNIAGANYTLMMTGPQRFEVNYTSLSSTWVQRTFPVGTTPSTNFHVYRWFNWGGRDFRINIDIIEGTV